MSLLWNVLYNTRYIQSLFDRQRSLKHMMKTNESNVGDKVKIMETRPISKDKRWRIVEIIEKAK